MVRFKVVIYSIVVCCHCCVSIPIWFDLKTDRAVRYEHSERGFNSYMVRFKVSSKSVFQLSRIPVSIPIWFDLKQVNLYSNCLEYQFQFLYGSI